MQEIIKEKGIITRVSRGDELVFRHDDHAKIKVLQEDEEYFLLGKLDKEQIGRFYRITFSDPLMDLQFDEMGIMADLSVVIDTNVVNTILAFNSEESAEAFLNGQSSGDLFRETVSNTKTFSALPVVRLDKAL